MMTKRWKLIWMNASHSHPNNLTPSWSCILFNAILASRVLVYFETFSHLPKGFCSIHDITDLITRVIERNARSSVIRTFGVLFFFKQSKSSFSSQNSNSPILYQSLMTYLPDEGHVWPKLFSTNLVSPSEMKLTFAIVDCSNSSWNSSCEKSKWSGCSWRRRRWRYGTADEDSTVLYLDRKMRVAH